MPSAEKLEQRLWDALRSDRTVMLGLLGRHDGLRPMTVQTDGERNAPPLWIFTSTESDLVQEMSGKSAAIAGFASKGHDLFATIQGSLTRSEDRAEIDRHWNDMIAAWYEGGRDDPKLVLLRFDATAATVWENDNSVFTGLKLMLGADPKDELKDNVADLRLK